MWFEPKLHVADVEYMPNGREDYLRRHEFDVRDVEYMLPDPELDVAEAEIDVFDIDFGNSGTVRAVRDLVYALRDTVIDVADVDYVLREHKYYLRGIVFDVSDVDFTLRELENDIADSKIDVAHVDFTIRGMVHGLRDIVHTLLDHVFDVGDVDCMLRGYVSMLQGMVFDAGDVEFVLHEADNGLMHRENESPDVEVVTDAHSDARLSVRNEALPAVVPDKDTLIRGFRLLAERFPGFIHLTPEEVRKMIRCSELDEELIAAALVAAEVWDRAQAQHWLQMAPEELHQLDKIIRESDDVIDAMRIALSGMEDANRVRKYRRGKAIFGLYRGLKILVNSHSGHDNYMRPYFENMQNAYMKNRKRKKDKAAAAE